MKKRWCVLTLFLMFLLSGYFMGTSAVQGQLNLNQQETFNYYMYFSSIDMNSVDGTISASEYPETNDIVSVDGADFVQVSFVHNGTHVKVAIRAEVFGWIGFGLGENGMLNSTLITSGADGTTAIQPSVWKGVGNQFPNFLSSLEDFNGSVGVNEDSTGTTVEFLFPLNGTAGGATYNWAVGGTYGFFLAAHNSSDQLVYHTYHTPRNLRVSILPDTQPFPQTISIDSLNAIKIADEVYRLEVIASNAPAGTEVEFRMASQFGGVLLGKNQTDASGNAELTVNLSIATFEIREIIAIIYPQQGFTGATESITINGLSGEFYDIYVHNIVADPEFDNREQFWINPDLFNNSGHLIGAVMIYSLLLIITMLIWEYVAAVMKLAYISLVGKKMEKKED